jgi:hypothetical protein
MKKIVLLLAATVLTAGASCHEADPVDESLPSARAYFEHVAMSKMCHGKPSATAIPLLAAYKIQVRDYLQSKMEKAKPAAAAQYKQDISALEADKLPPTLEAELAKTMKNAPAQVKKTMCLRSDYIIESAMANGDIAMAHEKYGPDSPETRAAFKRSLPIIQKGSTLLEAQYKK